MKAKTKPKKKKVFDGGFDPRSFDTIYFMSNQPDRFRQDETRLRRRDLICFRQSAIIVALRDPGAQAKKEEQDGKVAADYPLPLKISFMGKYDQCAPFAASVY